MPYTTMEPRNVEGLSKKASSRTRAGRWFRGLSLPASAGLTLFGLIVIGAIAWLLIGPITIGGFTWEISSAGINRAGATQIVLTMVAGAGAAVALVVTYRRQRRLEDSHFLERLGSAAAQLGDDKPAVQFSGIYALAALADESAVTKRQQAVDVLCAYIRLPYDPTATGKAGAQTRTEKTINPKVRGVQQEITVTTAHRPGEREVRNTIFRVVREHLKLDASTSWSELRLDFSGATIDRCDLEGAVFSGDVSFQGATFSADVSLRRTLFSGGRTSFADAAFSGPETLFDGAEFSGGVVSFKGAVFSGGRVSLNRANFSGSEVSFDGAEFSGGRVSIERAEFSGGTVSFFDGAFSGSVVFFNAVKFSGSNLSFDFANFSGGEVRFDFSTFSGGQMSFNSRFSGSQVSFHFVEFSGGEVSFSGAAFVAGQVSFDNAQFSAGNVSFASALFAGGVVSFIERTYPSGRPGQDYWGGPARFTGGTVSFEKPRGWTPPPRVPWQDGAESPEGVLPRLWPPELDPLPFA